MSHEDQVKTEIPATPTAEETNVVVPTTPAAPASDESTLHDPTVKPTEHSRGEDVRDYEKRLAEALRPAADIPPVSEPVGEQPPTPTETPDPAPTPAAEEPKQPEPVGETPTPEPTPTVPDEPEKEFRPRLTSLDARAREAVLLVRELKDKGQHISLGEAERRVNAKYGITDSQQPPANQQPPAPPSRTEDQILADIATKEREADEAAESLDNKTMLQRQREAFQLRQELSDLKISTREKARIKESQENAHFEAEVAASRQRYLDMYPAASQPNHAIHAKAAEIWADIQATDNPLVNDPRAPEKVYQMAANELGIRPLKPGTKPAVSPSQSSTPSSPKPQAVPQSAVRRPNPAVPVASGADRTTQPGPTGDSPYGAKPVRNAHDYSERLRELGVDV